MEGREGGGKLAGRVAIVTGASRGIGAAIVEELALAGATVVASAPAADPSDELAETLSRRGLSVRAAVADVTDPARVEELAARTHDELGRIDVLVNNAGVGAVVPTDRLPLDLWSRVLAVNLTGPLVCSQAVGRRMIAAGRGVIVNVGSIFGETGMPMRAAYAATKHGLLGLTRVLAVEWAPHGVRVVAVAPAFVRTGLDDRDQCDGGYTADDIARRTPLGRYAEPSEIARTVAFLASDDASFVTGSSVAVDGGWLAYGGW
jgi:3-oxoacyl-[acyl-carrier protein] reductase